MYTVTKKGKPINPKTQKYLVPKYTVLINWKTVFGLEAHKKITNEEAARKIISTRNRDNMISAIWYDINRQPLDLLLSTN